MATTYDPTVDDIGALQKVDRTRIIVDLNVRKEIRLDKSFISSIRVRGFKQYPVGWLDDDGIAHITVGQRRVSAALEIGWPVIPIVIKPKVDAEADRAEELRILDQLAENEQRSPLTDHERTLAYKQLALIGVTEEQIARKTNNPRTHVATALAVADSKVASKVLAAKPITLDQAAAFVEFEGDEDAIKALTETVNDRPEQLEHTASRLRRDRQQRQLIDDAVTKLEVDGWQIIRSQYSYGFAVPAGAVNLRDLHRAGDKKRTPLTTDDVAGLDGRVAVVYPLYADQAGASYYLKKPDKHGFESHAYSASTARGPLTDEEKDARRQKRIDRADFTAATDVRRTWLREEFLPRKHDLTDVGTWIVKAMIEHPDALRYNQARDDDAKNLTCELLDLELVAGTYSSDSLATLEKALAEATTRDELRVLLAFAIAKVEYPAGNPKHSLFGQWADLGPYLEQLELWGYTLSDIEQRLVAQHAKKVKR